jgi:uncharacterized protein YukE
MKRYSKVMGPHDVWNWEGQKTAGYVNLQQRLNKAAERFDEVKEDRIREAWFSLMARRTAEAKTPSP